MWLVRLQTLDRLEGCELILPGGDVGKPEVLEKLREIALPICLGIIEIGDGELDPRIVEIAG